VVWRFDGRSAGLVEEPMNRSGRSLATLLISLAASAPVASAADPPCDTYPPAKQSRCTEIWKELNKEDGPVIAQFGLNQQKRRDEGKINAQQHLAENMTFIKQSTEKRIERLKARMAKE
jgi:hypothetical protein